MTQVIIAPSEEEALYLPVFLAGGITNCKNWQKSVIDWLDVHDTEVSVFNPRRESFDITDKSASFIQVEWEFRRLEKMDIFSMYFCNGNSDQPICMYELGRNVLRMQNRFPSDWQKRIVVTVEDGYRRANDVSIQMALAAPNVTVYHGGNPILHATRIKECVDNLMKPSLIPVLIV